MGESVHQKQAHYGYVDANKSCSKTRAAAAVEGHSSSSTLWATIAFLTDGESCSTVASEELVHMNR